MPSASNFNILSGVNPSRRIFRGLALFVVLLVVAFILPPISAKGQTGLAAAGTAAMVFLCCLLSAGIVAVYLLIVALRTRGALSIGPRLAGYLPLPLLAGAMLCLWYWVIYRPAQVVEPPPNLPVTAPVTDVK